MFKFWSLNLILIIICLLASFFVASAKRQLLGAETIADETAISSTSTKLNETWEDILKRDLLVNYNKDSRPSVMHQNSTKVIFVISVKHIDLDELKGVVNLFAWTRMQWKDDKLQWNSSNYGGLKIIHLSRYEIWQPNLIVYNKAAGNDIDHLGSTFTLVYDKGTVLWVPPFQTSFFCDMNFQSWPFDTQNCSLYIGSWIIDDTEITLEPHLYDAVEIDPYIENNEWIIKNISIVSNLPEYSSSSVVVRYDFILERRSPMYKAIVITPASCIILLSLACFWLPPQSGEKIMLNGINLISITAFMVYFTQLLPMLAMNTPHVVLFYSSTLILICVSTMISVLVIFISNTRHKRKIPSFIKKILDGSIGKVLCLMYVNSVQYNQQQFINESGTNDKELQDQIRNDDIHNDDDNYQIINQPQNKSIQHDWILLATAIDRICFLIYSIIFIILAATYSV